MTKTQKASVDIIEEGSQAFIDGKAPYDNEYRVGSIRHSLWLHG